MLLLPAEQREFDPYEGMDSHFPRVGARRCERSGTTATPRPKIYR